ncbi:MAG: hypothetical protein PVG70_02175 [Desulfobacterales bacterium]|jgi:hypothetical protein
MDISSDKQLIPFDQGPKQVTPFARTALIPASERRNQSVTQYTQAQSSHSPKHDNQLDDHKPIYTSSRRINSLKKNEIGLLIDIYA